MSNYLVDFITLGCSKNLVDSESLIALFERNGLSCRHDPRCPRGKFAVINTCGFIEDAKQESIDTILRFAQRREEGHLERLYVMGCLSQRYREELEREIPQVDRWYGKFDFRTLVKDVQTDLQESAPLDFIQPAGKVLSSAPIRVTPRHYAYVKISEGCNRRCSYCAIPLITGRYVSRSQESILEEVRQRVADGAKELQIVAQDLTYYGMDIDGHHHIAGLVSAMSDIKGVKWIRLHYAYPDQFPMELLDVIRERPNVCSYLDIALQHISDRILHRMHRHVTKQETINLIDEIRRRVPGICLRTTLMVGFPGETEEEFEELMDFVRWARFERMGAFAYSEEDGTYSAMHYEDDVSPKVKQQRLDRLMALQQEISAELAAQQVGKKVMAVVDRKEGNYYIGRTETCSPEVDPEILIKADRRLSTGSFYQVQVTGNEEFDLYGEVI